MLLRIGFNGHYPCLMVVVPNGPRMKTHGTAVRTPAAGNAQIRDESSQ